MDLLFSICIPTYNRADILDYCLERLQVLEKFGRPFEIVVSDNASTDHTPQILEKRKQRMPYLRHVRQTRNVGVLGNFFNAMANGSGRFLVYLGDDDSIIPESL